MTVNSPCVRDSDVHLLQALSHLIQQVHEVVSIIVTL